MRFLVKKIIFTLLLLCSFSSLYAVDCPPDQVLKLVNAGYTKSEIESMCSDLNTTMLQRNFCTPQIEEWFIKLGIGAVEVEYPAKRQSYIDTKESKYSIEHTKIAIDLGLYWLVNPNVILGFNINGHNDFLQDKTSGYEMNISIYNYAFSGIYYLKKVQDGVYFRGDAGMAKGFIQESNRADIISSEGIGFLLGIGYSFDLRGTSLQIEVIGTNYIIEGQSYKSQQLMLSILF